MHRLYHLINILTSCNVFLSPHYKFNCYKNILTVQNLSMKCNEVVLCYYILYFFYANINQVKNVFTKGPGLRFRSSTLR